MIELVLGLALAFNTIIIIYKFKNDRVFDALLDAGILATIASIFGGSTQSLTVGTIGSAVVSIYLFFALKRGN